MEKLVTDSRMADHIEGLQELPGLQVEPLGLAELRAEFEAFKQSVEERLNALQVESASAVLSREQSGAGEAGN